MTDYEDVALQIARIDTYEVTTVINNRETLQLMRFNLPDGSQSPWLAFTPKQYADLSADVQKRQIAALEAEALYG